jgi:hypothetical protein
MVVDELEDDEIDLEGILKELGYSEGDDFESDKEEDGNILKMDKDKLKQLIRDVVLETLDEEDDLNEIIENITKNW